jgi:starch phosphorylase
VPIDRPVVGYGARCVNTLRLRAATAPKSFDFTEFHTADFVGAVISNVAAESLTRVLYPDDSTEAAGACGFAGILPGQLLVADILTRFAKATSAGPSCPIMSPFSSTTRTRRSPSPS